MKKVWVPVVLTLIVLLLLAQLGVLQKFGINKASIKTDEVQTTKSSAHGDNAGQSYATAGDIGYRFKTEGDYFYVYEGDKWKQIFIKGVNIGSGKPGLFPGELNISYDDYYRWFEMISAMNANSIRVYTAMMPDFYQALYDFNTSGTDNPLYIFHGVWLNEDDIATLNDVYAENNKILNQFKQDAEDMVDIIHGHATLAAKNGYASGAYTADVHTWLAGWILGMEFDPNFIKNVNLLHPTQDKFDGKYIYSQGATPFEAFLTEIGDAVAVRESTQYKWQVPIAFSNWVTTDPLTHPEEPYIDEDSVTLNTEAIKSRTNFLANMFASYHVYPYYPDSMNLQKDYVSFVDDDGKKNPYEAYLKDLKMAHTMPILIAEFGVSTARAMAHEGLMNYNQGKMEETDAGNAVVDMFRSIYKAKCAGGIVFAWQDEWFKRTWNNELFNDYERRPYWSDVQTCEQMFGLLCFDPGEEHVGAVINGVPNEWKDTDVVVKNDAGTLSMKYDEAYVYFMIKPASGFNFEKDTILIPIDTIANQGNTTYKGTNVKFSDAADFLISINGKENSRIMCDAYYDVFYFLYGYQYKMVKNVDDYKTKDSGIFNKMNMCIGYDMVVPSTKQEIPFASYETGKLAYGISDPESDEFYSLSDFYEKDGVIELRIPWELLNFMDPSNSRIMNDFYTEQSITKTVFDKFHVGFGIQGKTGNEISMESTFSYTPWGTKPTSHERLKKSYYILKDALPEIG